MYAVIRTGGKQYRVREGGVLRVEKLTAEAGTSVTFDEVLAVGSGQDVKIGAPLVDGGAVTATVRSHGKARKIEVVKFKRRQNYRRTLGHRQSYTEIEVTGIAAKGVEPAPRKAEADEPKSVRKTVSPKKKTPTKKKTPAKKASAKKSAGQPGKTGAGKVPARTAKKGKE